MKIISSLIKVFVGVTIVGSPLLGLDYIEVQAVKPSPEPLKTEQTSLEQELFLTPAPTIPDTVYSHQVTTHTTVAGFDLEEAEVSYTLNDTINNTFLLVAQGLTDSWGEYTVDSLPVLKHWTGIPGTQTSANENKEIIITNNGQGSNHLIRIFGEDKVAKEGYITNMLGQQIASFPLEWDPTYKTYTGVWNGENIKTGNYLFFTKTSSGTLSEKIAHAKNKPSSIDYSAGLNFIPQEKSGNAIVEDEAISKYIRNITSPFTEEYTDTVYVHEDMEHYFEAELEHTPINPSNINGEILVNNQFPAYNANIQIKNLTDENIIFNLQTDENGDYIQEGMPVPIDAIFTNPENTQYEITVTANNPNNFEEQIDIVDINSGENLLHDMTVEALPINPGSVSGTILVNNQFPAYNANIHIENSNDPSINFDFQTDNNGNFSQENIPVPLDELFTAPETSEYQIIIQAQNPNNWQEQTNDITITSEENLDFDVTVVANPIDPAEVVGQVLLNGDTPIANANLHWKNLTEPSTTYDVTTNAQGEYDENVTVPLDALFTNPEDTQYEVTTTGDNLETKIDTFMVVSGQQALNNINISPTQYDDGNVNGWIEFENGIGVPSNADIEYKRLLDQSMIFNTTAPNGFYQITVPIVYESENPGETKYIVTISPNGGSPFITEIDTVLVSPGSNGFQHYVAEQVTNPTQDIEGIVRNVYTKNIESGVTVRIINRNTGELIEEDITGADGKYSFENIPEGAEVEFELGKTNELWMVNNEYDVPANVIDTLVEFNRYFYPKTVEVPEVGTNTTIEGDGQEIAEIYGSDYINFEEILRDTNFIWANGYDITYNNARTWIQNNIYQGTSPIITAETQRDITPDMQFNYDPYTNFYAGQLGWNIEFGQGNSTTTISNVSGGNITIIGGEMKATGLLKEYLKETQYRRWYAGDVVSPAGGGRLSVMNSNPSMPDDKDRAYMFLTIINQDGRFDKNQETFSLENITSVEPTSKAATGIGIKEKPLPSATYQDIKGNNPHSKTHFNNEKYQEQLHFQRQEHIRSFGSQSSRRLNIHR